MQVQTTRFGPLEIDGEAVITFTQPIIGFPLLRRFVLVAGPPSADGAETGVKWLQSTEAPETAFLLMNPRLVYPAYEVDLGPDELAELAVGSPAELEVYTLLVVPHDRSQIRTNLKAPILINPRQRLGKQAVLDRKDYPIQYFLVPASSAAQPAQETSHARADA